MKNQSPSRRAALISNRSGFTLVELLVVIGIIAILAGVSLGPITVGIKKAKQSSGTQSAHAIGVSLYSFANDNSQLYPDTANPTGNTGTGAAAVIRPLLAGGYVSDPSIFYISGGMATKYTGTAASAASAFAATNSSWDFVGNGGPGVSSSNYQYLPIAWSAVSTEPTIAAAATVATEVDAIPSSSNPFGTDGMAIFYINNSAKFVVSKLAGTTPTVVMIKSTDNSGGSPSTAAVLQGGG